MAGAAFLRLGSVQFTEYESPSELALSSAQSLAIHDLIGGRRIIQPLGVVWHPISWDGLLRDKNAEARSETLQRMLADSKIQRLSYSSHAFDVVVKEYEAKIRHLYKIEYKISVEVVKDASGKATIATPTTIDSQINSANSNAQTHYRQLVALDPSASSIGPKLSTMGSSLDVAGPAAAATGPSAASAVSAIATAVATVQAYQQALKFSTQSGVILETSQLLNHLIIIKKNFATGQAPKTITVSGGSLHDIASQVYGDASLARDLAAANGIIGTFLPHGVLKTLVIPPLQSPQVQRQ